MKAKEIIYYNERYKGTLTDKECDTLEYLIKLDKENGVIEDLKHIIYNLSDSDVDTVLETQDSSIVDKPLGTLRDEQTIGVSYLYNAKNCILGDSVGMGKTVQVAGLLNLLSKASERNCLTTLREKGFYVPEEVDGKTYKSIDQILSMLPSNELERLNIKPFRYLILTEKNLSSQFRRELVKFTGEYVELISSGEQKVIDKFVAKNPVNEFLKYSVVGTHALLTTAGFIAWLEQTRQYGKGFPFDVLVVDESSCLGGKKSNLIVGGFKEIAKYFSRIVFLNATPFETKLDIFYQQLNLLDSKMLPTKQNFDKRYCVIDYRGMYPKPTGKYKNQEEFKRLIGYRYFARTRRDKGAKMIDCKGRIIYSPLSKVQKYWLSRTSMNRLVYDCPNYIDPRIEFVEENVPKLKSIRELLEGECKDADSILIFVHYKEAQNSLSSWLRLHGYTNRVLNGETKNSDREEIIEGFKAKKFKVLLTNVQKGLNFGACNYCIFYSFDPNPSNMIQFEGRTTRSFDIVGKTVYVLCSLGQEKKTLDEAVRERAKATNEMTNTDFSVILSILLNPSTSEKDNE